MALRPLTIVALAVLGVLLTACDRTPADAVLPVETYTLNGQALVTELALNPADRLQGLSDRPRLAEDRGMLFVFPDERRRAFVMRRCLIDIDIAFLNAAGEVINVHRMVREPLDRDENLLTRYTSDAPALMALELAAGGLDRYGLVPGTKIELPVRELRRRAVR